MGITRIKTSGYLTGTKYDSFLGGNPTYDPGAMEIISYATGTGASQVITFSSIPQTYVALQIRGIARCTNSGVSGRTIAVTFNGSTTGYAYHDLTGNGTAASAGGAATQTSILINNTDGTTAPAGHIFDIHDYASTTRNKTLRAFSGAASTESVRLRSGLWANTAAITSITLTASQYSFTTDTTFALYGIKGA